MKKVAAIAAIIAVFVVSRSVLYKRALRPVSPHDETRIVVNIPKGTAMSGIAALLEEKGAIRSAGAFKRYVKENGDEASLQAGSFVLTKSMDVPAVAEALTGTTAQESIITIPEGYTVSDIDALLADKGLTEPGDISACARTCDFSKYSFLPDAARLAERGGKIEGYLYPDTYFVITTDFDPQAFLKRLLSTFEERVVMGMKDDIRASGRDVQEIMTMASLIEEETRTDDERPKVSGILWKRFDEGIGLYVDASNRYALEKSTGALTESDLAMDSPYNLRKYRGLPPGPIANPGLSSIKAALNPEDSPYYYYLHGTDGIIRYAVTNDEHNQNKARYLR